MLGVETVVVVEPVPLIFAVVLLAGSVVDVVALDVPVPVPVGVVVPPTVVDPLPLVVVVAELEDEPAVPVADDVFVELVVTVDFTGSAGGGLSLIHI